MSKVGVTRPAAAARGRSVVPTHAANYTEAVITAIAGVVARVPKSPEGRPGRGRSPHRENPGQQNYFAFGPFIEKASDSQIVNLMTEYLHDFSASFH